MLSSDRYIDPQTGRAWVTPNAAARLSNTVTVGSWRKWALAGETSFKLRLETGEFKTAGRAGDVHLMIAESSVAAVIAIFDVAFGTNRPDLGDVERTNLTKKERAQLETATLRYCHRTGNKLASLIP